MARVGIDDSFFALGGDSIMSIQLVSRARKAGLEITPRAVFQHRTVDALAAVAKAVPKTTDSATTSDLPLVSLSLEERAWLKSQYPQIEDVLPLSPLQEGLLFHALFDAQGPDIYTMQIAFVIDGPLQSDVLQAAAEALVQRHASLRAAFWHDHLSRPVQVIVPAVRVPWRSIDLSLLDEAAREQRLTQILAEDCAERFDLAAPPLVRFTVIRLGADHYRLLFTHHHILMDGWSVPVLVQELLTLYARRGDGGALPRVTPYRDYLAWIAAQDRGAAVAAWSAALSGLEEPTLVAAHDRGQAAMLPERIMMTLGEPLTSVLSQQARARGLTLNTYIQGAWAMLLGRLTGRDDVVFGDHGCGAAAGDCRHREHGGSVHQHAAAAGEACARQACWGFAFCELQDGQSRLMAHQHLGLAEIQGLVGLGELFDTLVVFENYPIDAAHLTNAGEELHFTPITGHDASHYPLSLAAVPGERLRLRLEYRPDLFDRESVEALGARLIRLLEASVAQPDCAIGRLDILDAAERQTLLCDWNDTARAIPVASLPELFSAQAARSPEAVAAVLGEQRLSYAALDARANQLAHHLRRPRGRTGGRGWAVRGALAGDAGWAPWHPQGRRRLSAARSFLSARHVWPSCWRMPARRCCSPRRHCSSTLPAYRGTHRRARCRLARHRAAADNCPGQQSASAEHRLRDLHLGIDRHPKGVAVSHGGIPNLAAAQIDRFAVTAEARVLQFASPSFDASISEIATVLISGGSLILLAADDRGGEALGNLIRGQGVTHATLPPVVLARLGPRTCRCRRWWWPARLLTPNWSSAGRWAVA